MTKIKEIKTRNIKKRARITVKSLLQDVKKKLNKKQVEAVMIILETKCEELKAAKKVVQKLQKQIIELGDKDIEEIDTEDYEYKEEE